MSVHKQLIFFEKICLGKGAFFGYDLYSSVRNLITTTSKYIPTTWRNEIRFNAVSTSAKAGGEELNWDW